MRSNFKLIMFGLIVLILFQFYFAFYYLLGEGAVTSSPWLGVTSLILAFVLLAFMSGLYSYYKKNK